MSKLAKALKSAAIATSRRSSSFPFQLLDRHIARNQSCAKSLGVGRNHDVKGSCAPPEALASTRIWA